MRPVNQFYDPYGPNILYERSIKKNLSYNRKEIVANHLEDVSPTSSKNDHDTSNQHQSTNENNSNKTEQGFTNKENAWDFTDWPKGVAGAVLATLFGNMAYQKKLQLDKMDEFQKIMLKKNLMKEKRK